MNIHEYQAKEILRKNNVPVPEGRAVFSVDEAVIAAEEIITSTGTNAIAVKAQIHAGGRGKGGGVKIAKNIEEVKMFANSILGMTLITHQTGPSGKLVRKLLVEQGIYYPGPSEVKEFYMSILLNRANGRNMVLYSTEGGMDIESVAAQTPHLIFKEEINPVGLQSYQARRIAFNLGLSGKAFSNMVKFVVFLYNAYISSDASLFEINPVVKTSDDLIFAADAKMNIDDNSLFRHPDLVEYRDFEEEDPAELEASESNLNFIKLDGNVGCMVNGAGLAMATMDIIKLSGGEPANFLDVGGTANAKTVAAGFRIILKEPNVKAILINIFGGIVRCDRVAQGVVDAYNEIGNISIPVIVRLQGTNAREGKELIDSSGLKVYSAISLKEAAELVSKMV
ncbi:MAG TPA: ADP-forming succinate--CoA ligase subunit beta [Tenuifilaceae bacterium]|nr:ADP-forming succinate--CoA ligase subunit beta [Tenuifilaceae bacterium]HPE19209.1 ADP-forming succinate--CoA ligase subunit beta [Tenuifilaceae bacterium]HPJ46316.1 ADP-forming succinate--CoA ligase subunit beta [Tenuifilaceae bacterium]HRX68933.1 ADP-forming succinate--CoA ligase subunit beta [Tenuifilaceae bacterium]